MLLQTIIFFFFFVACCVVISKIQFYKSSGLKGWQLISLFAVKVAAGIAYGVFYKLPRYYETADTWRFFRLSMDETQWLKNDPFGFVKDLFVYGYNSPGGVFSGTNSYWNDLKSNIVVKLLAICNVLTLNNYYADVVLFNFFFFAGLIALYKSFVHIFPQQKVFIILGVFLLPSTLFWCSGIHKDGFILSATGIFIWLFFQFLTQYAVDLKKMIVFLFCLVLVFALRNYVLLALVPALFCWWLAHRKEGKTPYIFMGVYLIGAMLFFLLPHALPALNFPNLLANKQHEFMALSGGSELQVPILQPSFWGYLSYLPTALNMALLQPGIAQANNLSSILALSELFAAYILLVLFVLFGKWPSRWQAFLWFNMFFGLSILLIAGFTITFTGAIVRYRSLALPLLVTPWLCALPIDLKIWRYRKKLN